MARNPIVIVGTPEYKIANRALAIAGQNKDLVVSYLEWAACLGSTLTRPGLASCRCCSGGSKYYQELDASKGDAARERVKQRLSRAASSWNGEVFYVGHSQGAAHVYVGGYTTFEKNPNVQHRVSGGEYADFLNTVLPKVSTARLHLVIFACWLGDASQKSSRRFLRELLVGVNVAGTKPTFVHATEFETWYSGADDGSVTVNGVRRSGFEAYEDYGLAGLHAIAFMTDHLTEKPQEGGILKGKFDPKVDAQYRMKVDGAKAAREAKFTRLADILAKEYDGGGGKKSKVFTTFFWDEDAGELVWDRSNASAVGQTPLAAAVQRFDISQ
jgi:hypothetical protein